MNKKIISGILALLFIGILGVVTVTEAVGREDNRLGMEQRHKRHMGLTNDGLAELTKEETTKDQKEWKNSRDSSFNRREHRNRHGRMNNSCW
ncbi:hypothetical protein DOK67_0000176 [Enterococcus sp. DIV0212c]|uniref:hypothetical protein n=1 Tax=Enterococcus sp. DIV0212c TaxID=2230867 RepID=UPI001A9BBD05|nr:hypothetical protein [Enterococcus sp. DIV0212c]MBO1354023.1 hypothetical protein [Enterococcus sp. DIV0212c]